MEKRVIAIFLATAMLAGGFAVQASERPIRVVVNGQDVQFEDQQPIIIDGSTLVPIRGVFEAMGYSVEWEGTTRTVTIYNGPSGLRLEKQVGSDELRVTGTIVVIDPPSQIINERTMLPLRAISEALGADVEWDGTTQTVSITHQPPAPRTPVILTEPSLFTSEELAEMAERAFSREDTQPITPHPNRRMSEQELAAWIQEYQDLGGINSFELEVVREINVLRLAKGSSGVSICPNMSMAARLYGQLIFEHNVSIRAWNHTDPFYGTVSDRTSLFGVYRASENLFSGAESRITPNRAVVAWYNSPYGHRENMLDSRVKMVGIGVVGGIVVLKVSS